MAERPAHDVLDDAEDGSLESFDDLEAEVGEEGAAEGEASPQEGDAVAAEATDEGQSDLVIRMDEEESEAEGDDDALSAGGEEEEVQEPADEELDDEAKSYSKKVQDRILRERRIVKRTRAEAATAVRQEVERRIKSEKGLITANKNLAGVLIVNIDEAIKSKSAELRTAKEEGKTDDEVKLEGEIADLRMQRREVVQSKTGYEQQEKEFDDRAKEELARVSAPAQLTDATQNWLARNRWFGDKRFAMEAHYVRAELDQRIARRGLKPDSPTYFQELDKLIAAEIPDLKAKLARTYAQRRPGKPNGAVVPGGRRTGGGARSAPAQKRIVHITSQDKAEMRIAKLDPDNKDHVAQYAREKVAYERSQRR